MYIYVPVAYSLKVKLSAKLPLLCDICNSEFYAVKQLGGYNCKPIWVLDEFMRTQKRPGKRVSPVEASVKGDGRVRALEADAGDTAAGDLANGEGLAVFVGEVEETVSFGGLFQPVDEGFHLGVDNFLYASEADADDDERHVGDAEMTFGAFPQTELNGAVLAEVVDTSSDGVPVERSFIWGASKHLGDIETKVEEEVHNCAAGCRFDFLHGRCEC